MALRDKACYTLSLVPSLRDPNVLELVEAGVGLKGEARYARVRETRDGEVYSSVLYGESLDNVVVENSIRMARRVELEAVHELFIEEPV